MSDSKSQTTAHVLMVRPHRFGLNEQTMHSNAFQQKGGGIKPGEASKKAIDEFDQLVEALRQNQVNVIVKQDTPEPAKPDALFPNNWVMFHHSGDVSLFPMEAENRRYERRTDIIEDLRKDFQITKINDYTDPEKEGRYLEGTGSMVFDHPNRIAYACISSRTDPDLLDKFCHEHAYEAQKFESVDRNEKAIYHTNVIMSVGSKLTILCSESILNEKQKSSVLGRLKETGHQLIDISLRQVLQFAGNMIELKNSAGESLLVMSSRAYRSLDEDQLDKINQHVKVVHAPLDTIEDLGGGSARCMIAEVFLPLR